MDSIKLLALKRQTIKKLVKRMWSNAFMRYKAHVLKVGRKNKENRLRLELMNKKRKEICKELILRKEYKNMKKYLLIWNIQIKNENIAIKKFTVVIKVLTNRLLHIGMYKLIKDTQITSHGIKQAALTIMTLQQIHTKNRLRIAFGKYRMHILTYDDNKFKNLNVFKRVYDIMNKCKVLALRNANNKWRFNTHKSLKNIITTNISKKESKEVNVKNRQLINKIHMKSLKLLAIDYRTTEDIVTCKHLLTIISEVKDYLNIKTSAAHTVFTLYFPISYKEQTLRPYLVLDDNLLNDKMNKSQDIISIKLTEVFKSVNLTENFTILSLPSDDPVICLLNNGYNYYKPSAEPYVAAMKKRRIEAMDHGIALTLPKGTVELYWNCLSNVFTKVYSLITIGQIKYIEGNS